MQKSVLVCACSAIGASCNSNRDGVSAGVHEIDHEEDPFHCSKRLGLPSSRHHHLVDCYRTVSNRSWCPKLPDMLVGSVWQIPSISIHSPKLLLLKVT